MTEIESVYLRDYVICVGWGDAKHRTQLTSAHARIELDLAARVLHVTPRKRGEPLSIPLDMVRQWQTTPVPSCSADGPAPPVSARPRPRPPVKR